jgi:hypothetical protein
MGSLHLKTLIINQLLAVTGVFDFMIVSSCHVTVTECPVF